MLISRYFTLTEQADVDLLQGVDAAELVELVVHFIKNQSFVIVCSEVSHYVVHWREERQMFELQHNNRRSWKHTETTFKMLHTCRWNEVVHNFYPVKVNHDSSTERITSHQCKHVKALIFFYCLWTTLQMLNS